jgi:hypothetical protein
VKLHDLPVSPALCHDERHAPRRGDRVAVANTGQKVQAGNDNGGVRHDERFVGGQLRGPRPIVEQRVLEVRANSLGVGHDIFACRAHEEGVRRVKLDDSVDVRVRKSLRPLC